MYNKLVFGLLLVVSLQIVSLEAQSYEDKRCKCICPSIKSVNNNTEDDSDRMLIIDNVPPNKCNCDGVILPRIADKIKGKEQEFCPRCDCKYENRNTTIIKVVVIIVIWIISLLVIYMLFLMCLDPLLNKRVKANYQEHTNEDVNIYRDNNNSSINGFIKRDSYSVKFNINSSTATNVTGADSDSDSLEFYSGNVRDRERVRLLAAEDS
uniref:Uncharacterized protein CG1161 n=1 Tax=Culex pipiens TaxID=7175 RepID=A0A8D8ALC2_CULPI